MTASRFSDARKAVIRKQRSDGLRAPDILPRGRHLPIYQPHGALTASDA